MVPASNYECAPYTYTHTLANTWVRAHQWENRYTVRVQRVLVLLSCLGLQRKRRGKETKKYKQLLTPSHLFCFVLLRLFAIYFYCTQFLLAAAAHAALTTGSILAKSGVPSPVDASHPLMAFQPSLFSPMALVPAVTSRNMVGLE